MKRILLSFSCLFALVISAFAEAPKPNIIFVLADDLGYGDLGCFGQKHIQTPNLDKMAEQGMRLTDFYSGSTVCAPSRCVLMTGQDTGNCWVRGNANNSDAQTLRPEDVTVAEKMKEAGYATALFGKWGLGELDSSGHPNKQGFDEFYGYLNQRHAHNFYPTFLIHNGKEVALNNDVDPRWAAYAKETSAPDDGAGFASPEGKKDYAPELIYQGAKKWISEQAKTDQPFFIYYALNTPHANNEANRVLKDGQEVPSYGIYADKDWSNPNKGQAAMITKFDSEMGEIMELLQKTGQAENTLILFTSDNGHHKEGGNDPEFFDANGPLRGMKRDLTEGGIRVPTIAWWPGTIPAGQSTAHPAAFQDFMATACELAGVETPQNTQSHSFAAALKGEAQPATSHLYWEFYEKGSKQAVRFGKWKAIRRPIFTGEIELYDLSSDIGEETNLAETHPDLVKKAESLMKSSHTPNPNWKPRGK
ncbi:MAG: arylsulfatase [Verrucomicrobiota bacterium]